MDSIEKSTVTIKTAAAVIIGLLSIGASMLGNYFATRSAVQHELQALDFRIQLETKDRVSAIASEEKDRRYSDTLLSMRLSMISRVVEALKPEEPRIKRER